jgi:hypothetical protein
MDLLLDLRQSVNGNEFLMFTKVTKFFLSFLMLTAGLGVVVVVEISPS